METGPIQGKALGLLSLLNLKNQGREPRALEDVVRPTIELLEWYLTRDQEIVAASGTVPNGNSASSFDQGAVVQTVPDNELWYLWNASIQFNVAVGATEYVTGPAITFTTPLNLPMVLGVQNVSYTGNATTALRVRVVAEPRRFFLPRTIFGAGWALASSSTGGYPWSLYLQITRLRI